MKQSISWWVLHKVKEGRTVNSRPIRRSAAIKFCDIDEERAIRPVFLRSRCKTNGLKISPARPITKNVMTLSLGIFAEAFEAH
jgi:hypothetical protein